MQTMLADASAPLRHPFCALCEAPASASSPDSARCVRMALRAGMRLFERGARTAHLYVVQSGIVKETTASPDGSECAVRLVMRGGVCGLPALAGRAQPHSAHVIHPGTACRIPVASLQGWRARDAEVVDRLFLDWMQAVQDADCMISVLGHGAARSRMARLLLMLDQANETSAPLRLRRSDMADLLAITPVSVARLLSDFSREALFMERDRRVVALDHDRLRQIARTPSGHVGAVRRGRSARRVHAPDAAES
jgi:CRP-like cAMP-binding protein